MTVLTAPCEVSFPHYFLQATGHLAEQLKTREWIVARITSIAERVVDQKVRSSKNTTFFHFLNLHCLSRIPRVIHMDLGMASNIIC